MPLAERIDKILTDKELDLKEFSISCGIAPDTLKKAIKRGKLSSEIISKIHDKYHVNKEYLKSGKGDPYVKNGTSVNKPATLDEQVLKLQDDKIRLMDELIEQKNATIADLQRKLDACLRGKK